MGDMDNIIASTLEQKNNASELAMLRIENQELRTLVTKVSEQADNYVRELIRLRAVQTKNEETLNTLFTSIRAAKTELHKVKEHLDITRQLSNQLGSLNPGMQNYG